MKEQLAAKQNEIRSLETQTLGEVRALRETVETLITERARDYERDPPAPFRHSDYERDPPAPLRPDKPECEYDSATFSQAPSTPGANFP